MNDPFMIDPFMNDPFINDSVTSGSRSWRFAHATGLPAGNISAACTINTRHSHRNPVGSNVEPGFPSHVRACDPALPLCRALMVQVAAPPLAYASSARA